MAFEVDPDLNQALMPLAWMIGRWQGNGHGSWPGMGDFEFGQQIGKAGVRPRIVREVVAQSAQEVLLSDERHKLPQC